MLRTIVGFIISPLIGLLFGCVYFNLSHPEGFGWLDGPVPWDRASITYFAINLFPTYLGVVVVGIPAYILFKRRGWDSISLYAILGILGGWITIRLLFLNSPHRGFHFQSWGDFFPMGMIQPGLIGFVVGIVFWLIAVRNTNQTMCAPIACKIDAENSANNSS